MKGIILFKSQYGSTEQYARWLSEDTGVKAVDIHEADPETVKSCEFVVIGSHIKIGHIQATDWIKTHWEWLKDKKLILFGVSGSYANKKQQREVLETSLPEDWIDEFQYFSLPGRLNKRSLNWWDRFIVSLGSRIMRDEEARSRMKEGFDYVDKKRLEPVKKLILRLSKQSALEV